ncbi:MAG: YjjG family noncanonical pyrimidine nucleotidase [Bacteroidota bacterium]
MKKKYKHIFFDLDHTLWDTDRNSAESLIELYKELNLADQGFPSFPEFIACYRSHNERLWGLYSENKIGRDAVRINRFRFTLEDFGIRNFELASILSDEFVKRTPYKPHLIENTLQVLEKISGNYHLSIITNGFKESQAIKLQHSGIENYFSHLFISEEVGFNKPDVRIFEHALNKTSSECKDSLMVGDTYETDITGARAANIDQVYLKENPPDHHEATYKITNLSELLNIL